MTVLAVLLLTAGLLVLAPAARNAHHDIRYRTERTRPRDVVALAVGPWLILGGLVAGVWAWWTS